MSTQLVRSLQGETMDSIAHRYYTADSVAMLPLLITSNQTLCDHVVLPTNSVVLIPDQPTQQIQRQALSLWD